MRRFLEYLDRLPPDFDSKNYIKLKLNTGCFRKPLEYRKENEETIAANNSFDLYFSIPENFKSIEKNNLLVMTNGFNEIRNGLYLYFAKEYSITRLLTDVLQKRSELANGSQNVAATLLPIPFHHWRRPLELFYREWDSATMISNDPLRLYLGFRQLIYDFDRLQSQIFDKAIDDEYQKYFHHNTSIHLLGYSLGGLAALAAFIRDKVTGNSRIETCSLLASGVDLRYANFIKSKISRLATVIIRGYYAVYYDSNELEPEFYENGVEIPEYIRYEASDWKKDKGKYNVEEREDDELIDYLFERLVLGYDKTTDPFTPKVDQVWTSHKKDIRYILCERDPILNFNKLDNCIPYTLEPDQMHTMSGVNDHLLIRDPTWKSAAGLKAIEYFVNETIVD